MKHLLNNNKKHTTVKGNNMAMKPKKRTSPKIAPIIPPIVGAIAGAAGRAAGRGAAKKVGKNIVKRKATGIRDAKGLRKMEKALSGSKGPKRKNCKYRKKLEASNKRRKEFFSSK
jgi:hypothetical protein